MVLLGHKNDEFVTSSSGWEMVFEAGEAASLCRSHTLQQTTGILFAVIISNTAVLIACMLLHIYLKAVHVFFLLIS